jgi:anti-anti-sigma regulatory factor
MIPQISKRKIGNVTVIDIKGEFTGHWALREEQGLKAEISSRHGSNTIINLKEMTSLDTVGARVIFESLASERDVGMLLGNENVMDVLNRFSELKRFRVYQNESDVVEAFGPELVACEQAAERRKYPRLFVALPIEFYRIDEEDPAVFKAIVTNFSLGGCFAEYIDLKIAERSLERLNPYDIKLLHFTIALSRAMAVQGEGRVAHYRINGAQLGIGIEICKMDLKDQEEVKEFLNQFNDPKS